MLTPKQEAFCIAYIETGNASEAYRQAYKAKGMSLKTINEAASRLASNSKVIARLQELRAPVVERAQITLEQHLLDLQRLRDLAEAAEKFGPAVTAEMARGKASGFYVDRVEHSGKIGLESLIADDE